ncbi:hypothetical protein Dimus_008969 [Dionaea muscipula]
MKATWRIRFLHLKVPKVTIVRMNRTDSRATAREIENWKWRDEVCRRRVGEMLRGRDCRRRNGERGGGGEVVVVVVVEEEEEETTRSKKKEALRQRRIPTRESRKY